MQQIRLLLICTKELEMRKQNFLQNIIQMRLAIPKKLTKTSMTKGWSDQEVNAQIDRDLNP